MPFYFRSELLMKDLKNRASTKDIFMSRIEFKVAKI